MVVKFNYLPLFLIDIFGSKEKIPEYYSNPLYWNSIVNLQVCYDMSSPKTEKREVDSIVECAGELKCDNLVIVTHNDKRIIEKDGYTINVVPVYEF